MGGDLKCHQGLSFTWPPRGDHLAQVWALRPVPGSGCSGAMPSISGWFSLSLLSLLSLLEAGLPDTSSANGGLVPSPSRFCLSFQSRTSLHHLPKLCPDMLLYFSKSAGPDSVLLHSLT